MKRISFSAPGVAASETGAEAGVGVGEGSADAGVPTAAPWTGGTPDGEKFALLDAVIDGAAEGDDESGSAAGEALALELSDAGKLWLADGLGLDVEIEISDVQELALGVAARADGVTSSLALAVLEREASAEFDAEPKLEIDADSLAKADPEG